MCFSSLSEVTAIFFVGFLFTIKHFYSATNFLYFCCLNFSNTCDYFWSGLFFLASLSFLSLGKLNLILSRHLCILICETNNSFYLSVRLSDCLSVYSCLYVCMKISIYFAWSFVSFHFLSWGKTFFRWKLFSSFYCRWEISSSIYCWSFYRNHISSLIKVLCQ